MKKNWFFTKHIWHLCWSILHGNRVILASRFCLVALAISRNPSFDFFAISVENQCWIGFKFPHFLDRAIPRVEWSGAPSLPNLWSIGNGFIAWRGARQSPQKNSFASPPKMFRGRRTKGAFLGLLPAAKAFRSMRTLREPCELFRNKFGARKIPQSRSKMADREAKVDIPNSLASNRT